jgi:two-component system phosphate regulon sensor histidine kinase PhoR
MSSFRSKITAMFLVLIGCSVLGTGIFVALLLRSSYLDSLTSRLVKEGHMIAETIDWSTPEKLQRQAEVLEHTLDARITLIAPNGDVIGDSEKKETKQQNLKNHPLVQKALRNEPVEPMQDLKQVYAMIPVVREGKVVGVIQISINLDEVNASLEKVWISLTGGLVIAYLLAGFASSRIASGVTRPIEEITQVAVDIAQKRFHRRVNEEGKDEIGRLGRAINRMAESLQFQLETIRKNERRLKSVIESMESGLLLINSRGRISIANRAFERMFGIPAHDLIGLPYERLSCPSELAPLVTECAEKQMRIRKELHLHEPEERILEANLAPMWVEPHGVGVVAVFHDLTAIRRLEQMRRDFVANVSHELKTPVTSIRGFAETLLDGAMEEHETCKEFLQIILKESIRLQRLVSDLLDLSQIESKQFRLKLENHDVERLVHPVVKTLEDQIRGKQLALAVEIPENFVVQVDADRFQQILLNLLANAMNYTPAGGKITLRVEKVENHWRLIVADTGIGIPKEDLPRIFERFYRVDKARSRDSGGTGLGLAIVKHLVEVHHGKIQVESTLGKGTCFTLTFPMQVKPQNA